MSLKAIMAAGAMLALMATPGLSQEKPKTHEFNMATGWSGGPLMDIGAKAFADKVKELSDGRIQIEVHPAGTLGPGPEGIRNREERCRRYGPYLDWI